MSYRELKVWEKARSLSVRIYKLTAAFPRGEVFGLVQQMRRAAVSIVCNIAEGQGRWSHRDQCKFYYIARGSVFELEAQLIISTDLEYVDGAVANDLLKAVQEVGRMLSGLINKLSGP